MSIIEISSRLEEAVGSLLEAKMMAERIPDEALVKAIGHGISALRAPRALAEFDPGDAWLDETGDAWEQFSSKDYTCRRFAASIAAKELGKYKLFLLAHFPNIATDIIDQQIRDLEAIAKGGGE